MTNTTIETKDTTHRHWYAVRAPRGFWNERQVLAFPSREARDEFLSAERDGEWRSPITRPQAREALRVEFAIPGNCAGQDSPYNRMAVDILVEDDLIPPTACRHLVVVG